MFKQKGYNEKTKRQPVPMKFCCGTPHASCTGTMAHVNAALRDRKSAPSAGKVHGTSQEAYSCRRAYLVSLGYVEMPSHSFAAPNDGPVLVLPRPSRMLGLRAGKAGTRHRPKGKHSGFITG